MIRTYSSGSYESNKKEQWLDLLEKELGWPVELNKVDEQNFQAEFSYFSIDRITFIHHTVTTSTIERQDKCLLRAPGQIFSLNLLIKGQMVLFHHQRKSSLNSGDMVLANSASPSTLVFEAPSRLLTARIPGNLLGLYLPNPEHFCNVPLSSSEGFAHVLKELLFTLWQRGQRGAADELLRMSTKPFLDLLALSCLMTECRSADTPAPFKVRLSRIKQFIEENISDSNLCPEVIASEFKLSARYLRKLFAAEGDCISKYIHRCRLQTCAEQLANLVWRNSSITDICFRLGFSSSAHFTRSFKAHYGVTPKEYRRKVLQKQSS